MSNREQVLQMVNAMPDYKIDGLLVFLRAFLSDSDDAPNAVTIAALQEGDEMLRTGTGQGWTGSTEELFRQILEEEGND